MCPTEEEPMSNPFDLDRRECAQQQYAQQQRAAVVLDSALPMALSLLSIDDNSQHHQDDSHRFQDVAQNSDFSVATFSREVPSVDSRHWQRGQPSQRGTLSESPQRNHSSMQAALGPFQRDSASESPRRNRRSKMTPADLKQQEHFPQSPKRTQWSGNVLPLVGDADNDHTTVMLRNLPNDYSRDMLIELLETKGFSRCYDFVYLPFDFKKGAGLGYAFLNLVNHQQAIRAMTELAGFHYWKVKSQKVLQVTWSKPLQGLVANVDRYRNSPVMHPDVPEQFKPLMFRDGMRVVFPAPTKALQMPNIA